MRIQDLEVKSGLDRATIRYYEKQGMIAPVRHENGYRDYSQADVQTLEKIKLLRQLGMSLDQIRQLQQGSGGLQDAINAQMPKLSELRDHAQRALQVCKLMRDDHATFDTLNADYYLKQLKSMAVQFPSTVKVPAREFREVVWREWHPARRFFARMTDQFLMVLIIVFIQIVFLKTGLNTIVLFPFNFLSYLLIIPAEAICIHYFGATFGKYVFGIHIRAADGRRLSLGDSFRRSWEVYRYGLGFGIPFWSLWRLYGSYKHYDEYEMDWDYDCELSYPTGKSRNITAIIAVILSICMITECIFGVTAPRYTDRQLNIQQFSENYNYYWQVYGYETEWGLSEDGTFKKLGDGYENWLIYINGKLSFSNFNYELTENAISKINYQETAYDFFWYDGIPTRGVVAAAAILSAREGQNNQSCAQFREEIETRIRSAILSCEEQMSFTHNGLQITWSVEMLDATFDGSMIVGKDTEDAKSQAKVSFTIHVIE